MVYYLLACVLMCSWINMGASQFFYSSYTPLPLPYTSLFPQLPQLPQQYFPQYLPQVQISAAPATYNQIDQNQAVARSAAAPYRGFGYRTDFKDGASSTVFFLSGPQSGSLGNQASARTTQSNENAARNLASNILDNNAIGDIHGHIRNILEPAQFQTLFDSVNTGAFHFYNFPAGTAPLTKQAGAESNGTEVTTATPTTTTAASTTEENEDAGAESNLDSTTQENEAEVAESKIDNTQVLSLRINIDAESEPNASEGTSSTTPASTTESTTTAASTTAASTETITESASSTTEISTTEANKDESTTATATKGSTTTV